MKYPVHIVETLFLRLIERASIVSKNYGHTKLKGRCPKCGDSKKKKFKTRFYCLESSTHWTVHCHNCGYNTTFEKMIETFFPEEYDNLNRQCLDQIKTGEIFKKNYSKSEKKSVPTNAIHNYLTHFFKKYCIPLTVECDHPKKEMLRKYAYNKMKKRGIAERYLNEFFVCYRGTKELKKYTIRVIIPFMTKEGLYYNFQARDIHPKPDQIRLDTKYIFALFENIDLPSDKIYRQYHVSKNRTVYICEGILDSLFIENSIALCNANVVGEKAEFITDEFNDRVWVLDSPWVDKTGYEKICLLLNKGETCFVIPKKYKNKDGTYPKDINDLALILGVETIPLTILRENLLTGKRGLLQLKLDKLGV